MIFPETKVLKLDLKLTITNDKNTMHINTKAVLEPVSNIPKTDNNNPIRDTLKKE
jgi:hypothetical protein